MNKIKAWKDSEPVRLYVYSVLAPLLALLAAKGVLSGEDALYYGALAAAALTGAPAVEKVRALVDSPATASAKQEALEAEFELNVERENDPGR